MTTTCFLTERTGLVRHSMRRYVFGAHGTCSLGAYHNAVVVLHDGPADDPAYPHIADVWEGDGTYLPDKADLRWPTTCACGYVFTAADEWQYNRERLYQHPQTKEVFLLHDAPAGAMWFSPWFSPNTLPPTPEELASGSLNRLLSVHYWRDWYGKRSPITVQCPGNTEHRYTWCVDQTANNGDGWTVTGEAPLITCSPSILVPNYHGWLRNGVFSDSV